MHVIGVWQFSGNSISTNFGEYIPSVYQCAFRAWPLWVLVTFTVDFLVTFELSTASRWDTTRQSFCRAMLCKRDLSRHAVSVCVCVCPSVTFVDSVETNKHVFKIFSPSGSHTILIFFRTKRHGNIPTATHPIMAWNAKGGMKNHDFRVISRFISELMQDRAVVTMEGE